MRERLRISQEETLAVKDLAAVQAGHELTLAM